ncbi:MAG: type III polyketide synthase [Vulcanimicrobiaceae bacterium]
MQRIASHDLPDAARLISIATAVPAYEIDQRVAEASSRAFFGDRLANYDRVAGVFTSTGIERRYSVRPVAWFAEPHGWPDRTAAYVEGASELFERAVARALVAAGLEASAIDAVVTVSSTGVSTPSLEARVLPKLGFRPDVERTPVFGLGCAGGVTGLALASRLATARRGTTVLLVAVELCTLAFRADRATKADVIATALFGDGAAAAIVSSDPDVPGLATFGGATEHLWHDTLDIMGWDVDDAGLGVLLSRSLPAFVERRYAESFEEALVRLQIERAEIGRVVCHPGGTKVLEAIEAALRLATGTLDLERHVMRDYGNMSSPTVLFVLERAIAAGLPTGTILAALGPGFTASFVALEREAA